MFTFAYRHPPTSVSVGQQNFELAEAKVTISLSGIPLFQLSIVTVTTHTVTTHSSIEVSVHM